MSDKKGSTSVEVGRMGECFLIHNLVIILTRLFDFSGEWINRIDEQKNMVTTWSHCMGAKRAVVW